MPPKSLKRKSNSIGGEVQSKRIECCILHVNDIEHGNFTPLSNVRGTITQKLLQLHEIRKKRLSQPQDSPFRIEEVCNLIPADVEEIDLQTIGYHRGCYQNFTKNLDRLTSSQSVDIAPISRSPRKMRSLSDQRLFPETCIFCEKLERQSKGKTERCVKFAVFKERGAVVEPTWKQIESRALELGESRLHRLVQGQDLFAREAQYHRSCRKTFNLRYINYLRDTERAKKCPTPLTEQDIEVTAHRKAFNVVLDFIQDTVICKGEVVLLVSLRDLYVQELERNGFSSQEYRSETLKSRLEKHEICELIDFAKVNLSDRGCITYNLVYSASISVAEAVAYAYKSGSMDKIKDVALLLRNLIQQAFKQSKPLSWPPTADDLEVNSADELLPADLVRFLNYIISGEPETEKCKKTRRITLSIGQVINDSMINETLLLFFHHHHHHHA